MSQTQLIKYGEQGFWGYDVAVGVFLKHLIDHATKQIEQPNSSWLRQCLADWRASAVISDYTLSLDADWTADQRQIIQFLIQEACATLETVETISAEEAASWKILGDHGVFARGATQIRTAPVAEMGRAIGLLLDGTLPKTPQGTWWFYGN